MTRSVVITGGTGGLGSAVTAAMLANGWQVVVPWVAEHELSRVEKHENLTLVRADLSTRDGAVLSVSSAQAPLKAVVNLVGGFAMGGRVHETPVEDFEAQLTLNLRPAYLVCQAALPLFDDGGSVILVSSQSTRRPFAGAAGYLTAKTAVLGFAAALDAEYPAVRVNTILPSVIDTPANRASQPDADHSAWTSPQSIADTIAFLCDDASSAIRNSQINV